MPGIDKKDVNHVLISRVDAIGDVVLTLPVCSYLKHLLPGVKVSFLGKTYTKPVIESCGAVDEFIDYNALKLLSDTEQVNYLAERKIDAIIHVFPAKHIATLAKKAGIKFRVGTTNRPYHWFTCNKLVKLSRKNSDLHEAQLNLKLLEPFGMKQVPEPQEIVNHYDFEAKAKLAPPITHALATDKFNLILHPKSHGSGAEWGLAKFTALIDLLPEKFNIIITGSDKEKEFLKGWIADNKDKVTDLTGKMTLDELIAFIGAADGLVAAGTGPLHIAAASGIFTLGLFPCVRPIHPGRWAPVGLKAEYLQSNGATLDSLSPEHIYQRLQKWIA